MYTQFSDGVKPLMTYLPPLSSFTNGIIYLIWTQIPALI